jgi:hypothetical protein
MASRLTAGGAYVTGETKTSFKGYMAPNFAAICGLEMPLF